MKIAILADALDTQSAGIHVYVRELLAALHGMNLEHEIHIIRPGIKPMYPKWSEHFIPIKKNIPLHQRWRQFTSIPKLINSLKPDVAFETAHFGPFRLIPSVRRVTMFHDLTPITHPQYHSRASHYAHRIFMPKIVDNSDQLITNSRHTELVLHRFYPSSSGKTSAVLLAPRQLNTYESEEPVVSGNYILSVGTIEPRKNHIQLLEAFEQMQSSTKLVFAGAIGWKSKSLIERIKSSAKIKDILLLGKVSDHVLVNLYKHAVVMVYPSHYEGFGLPIIEAMYYGCPVLCSRTSSLPEVAGDAAQYFPVNDVNALASMLDVLINNNFALSKMRQKSLDQSKKFSWTDTGMKTLNLLVDVV